MSRIKINDLTVNLEELKKKDPEILSKIRGGAFGAFGASRTIIKMPFPESNYYWCRPDSKTGTTLCDTTSYGCA